MQKESYHVFLFCETGSREAEEAAEANFFLPHKTFLNQDNKVFFAKVKALLNVKLSVIRFISYAICYAITGRPLATLLEASVCFAVNRIFFSMNTSKDVSKRASNESDVLSFRSHMQ